MASASLLKNSEPDLGFFRPRLAPTGLRKPTLRSFDKFGPHAVGLSPPSSGVGLPTGGLEHGIMAGDYQADCYKVRASFILASVLDKGEPAAR